MSRASAVQRDRACELYRYAACVGVERVESDHAGFASEADDGVGLECALWERDRDVESRVEVVDGLQDGDLVIVPEIIAGQQKSAGNDKGMRMGVPGMGPLGRLRK